MRTFKSKRNRVYLCDGMVIKRVSTPEVAEREAALLRGYRAAGVDVPTVLGTRGNEIMLEYIAGEAVPDFLERIASAPDDAALSSAALALCGWFEQFYAAVDHQITGEIRGDVNGRNFLLAGGRAVGVDFEGRAFGSAEQDIGRFLAFIRAYDLDTRVSRRFAALFCRAALGRLHLSATEVLRHYRLERGAMRTRRADRGSSHPS